MFVEISAGCLFGRYSGEELLVVFPATNIDEAGAVGERLRVRGGRATDSDR